MKIALKTQIDKDVEAATIVAWHKKVGDCVSKGELLLQIETMKAEIDIESPANGILAEICANDGEEILRKEGSTGSWHAVFGYVETEANIEEIVAPSEAPVETNPKPNVATETPNEHFPKAAPLVRTMARERKIDLATISGKGPGGTVTLNDLDRAGIVCVQKSQPDEFVIEPLTSMRKTIARNLAKADGCILLTPSSIMVNFRRFLEAKSTHHALRLDAIVIEGIVRALEKKCVLLNACFGCEHLGFEGVKRYQHIDLGYAYNHKKRGLMVPVMQHMEGCGYEDIVERIFDLKQRAEEGRLKVAELQNPTFTFNNVGVFGLMWGVSRFTEGQSAMCTLYAVQEEKHHPLYGYGYIGSSFDHRLHDGAIIGTFLGFLKDFVENHDYSSLIESMS